MSEKIKKSELTKPAEFDEIVGLIEMVEAGTRTATRRRTFRTGRPFPGKSVSTADTIAPRACGRTSRRFRRALHKDAWTLRAGTAAEYQTRLPDKKMLQAKLHEFYELALAKELP